MSWSVLKGDCLEVLPTFDASSFDSVVTDPPYELGFMGKAWDGEGIAYSVELWREVLRVLKPGGHLLAFGGTRTYHRMTCAIEDAGFEIRDSLHWMYGNGFPKSLNVGDGRGTALKPAHEPIVLARKPLIGTVAANVLAHGTGALNIDASRIETTDPLGGGTYSGGATPVSHSLNHKARLAPSDFKQPDGRWPANVLLDESAAAELDAQSLAGGMHSAGKARAGKFGGAVEATSYNLGGEREMGRFGDSGGASRFFYVAKPSRAERDLGCEALPARTGGEATDREDDSAGTQNPRAGAGRTGGARNYHPTVKPIALMRYLVKLVTPPGGLVLDPFAGSGTTGCAAMLEGRGFLGIEREADYATIARLRIDGNETNAAQPEEPQMAKQNGKKPAKVKAGPKREVIWSSGAERTLSRAWNLLPVKLDRDGLAKAGVALAVLLGEQGDFERESKETKAGIKTQEDALQAKVDEAAAVIRSGEEVRKVEVEIRADFKTGMVAVVRLDTRATVTTRKLTDDERQQKLVLDDAEEDAGADEEPESSTAVWNVGSGDERGQCPPDLEPSWPRGGGNGVQRSPLPDGQP